VADAGDLDGDGRRDVAIGADGEVWLALSTDFASLRRVVRPTAPGDISAAGAFGASLARFEASGVRGLAIGAPLDGAAVAAGASPCEGIDGTPADHATECRGTVAWLYATDITPAGDITPTCVTRGPTGGARFGAALRGLGASPVDADVARVAIGAPSTDVGSGSVFVVDVGVGCTVATGDTITGTTGERFGATLGQ
jgi:hypothetical protein